MHRVAEALVALSAARCAAVVAFCIAACCHAVDYPGGRADWLLDYLGKDLRDYQAKVGFHPTRSLDALAHQAQLTERPVTNQDAGGD